MIKTTSKLAGSAALSLALVATAMADVKVTDHISVNGYAVGSWTNTDWDNGPSVDTTINSGASNLDAVKFGVVGTLGSLSSYASVLYVPGMADPRAGLLDAYVTYDTGLGAKITGGKFLSYLGYEAFDPINMAQLTYGSTIFAIPGYHTGVKLDFSGKVFSVGVALVDSIFAGAPGFMEGDREYSDDIGYEVVATFTGIEKLTVFAGIASEDTYNAPDSLFIFDLWASYAVTDKVSLGAEYDIQDNVGDAWLVFASYKFTDKFSTAFRAGSASWDAGGDDQKYTIAPTYTIDANFSVRAELTAGRGDSGDYTFVGAQAIFKF